MNRSYSVDAIKEKGKEALVQGWVSEVRKLGGIMFFTLRDRTGLIQVTVPKKNELFTNALELKKESVVSVKGLINKSKQAPGGAELIPSSIEVLAVAEQPIPLDISGKIESNLDKRLDWRVLDLRTPKATAIFKVESKVIQAIHEHLQKSGFFNIITPRILGVPAEGGSEIFPVIYFEKEAFLRQDPQLHRQLTIAGGLDKIYEVGPSWRAEQSHTIRHVCEHDTVACEISFIKDEHDVMKVEEELFASVIKKVKEDCAEELKLFNITLDVPKTPFPVLEFPEVYKLLEKLGHKNVKYGEDIDGEAERLLTDYVKKKYDSDVFFVNKFPSRIKPFYVMREDSDPIWARSTDMIFKGLEMSSGGQREHRHEQLLKQVAEKKMTMSYIQWFTDVFKYGVPPHGGFSIGIQRLVMKILGLENIREAILFPRDVERLIP
ncbi:MAG TPA: aspartate--tRNA(Asn) ligase [Candidatus Nanoarchaeia archaeon]|nr:aspartate--tRNA(Asn) ligase [Candidatus Nanoarchaeia archaeon]